MNPKIIGISIASGVATTLCIVAASQAGVAGGFLIMVAPLPVYLAALGFGTQAAIGASVVALLTAAIAGSPMLAVLAGLLYTIPASVIGHQANLAQQREDGTLEWYPIDRLLFNLAILLSVGAIIMAFFAGYDPDSMVIAMQQLLRDILSQNPQAPPLSDADLTNLVQFVLKLSPFLFGGFWLIIHCVNYQLASAITRNSGFLPRPKDDVAASLSLPKIGALIAVGSLVLAVSTTGFLQFALGIVAGVFNMALAFIGLAAVHERARTNAGQFVLLVLSYIIIVIFYFPIVLFAIGGIIRIFSNEPQNSQSNQG